MIILNGQETSQRLRADIRDRVAAHTAAGHRAPHLGVIQVGADPASTTYVNSKHRACLEAGIRSTVLRLDDNITQQQLLDCVAEWNADPDMDGFIVQLPLPRHINAQCIIEAIAPGKDVDGFHPVNQGRLMMGLPTFVPATPMGIMTLLNEYQVPLRGKDCVVIGRSNIVGRPIANMLSEKGIDCTVTLCHSHTADLKSFTRRADIIIAAIGSPLFIKADMVKEGVSIVDVGINRVADPSSPKGYRLVGDVDFESVAPLCQYITPVPGGVGPMTILSLLQNTLKAAKME